MEELMMLTNIKKPFSEMEIGGQFYFDGECFKKTDITTAWSIYNNALRKEWSFSGHEEVMVKDFTEMIPLRTEEELEYRAEQIKALIKGKVVVAKNIINQSYIWDPQFTGEEVTDLEVLCEIRTYHGFGYHGLFKPSIAEVLACIPDNLIELVGAFELVAKPETSTDLNFQLEYVNAGFHQAVARLYKKKI